MSLQQGRYAGAGAGASAATAQRGRAALAPQGSDLPLLNVTAAVLTKCWHLSGASSGATGRMPLQDALQQLKEAVRRTGVEDMRIMAEVKQRVRRAILTPQLRKAALALKESGSKSHLGARKLGSSPSSQLAPDAELKLRELLGQLHVDPHKGGTPGIREQHEEFQRESQRREQEVGGGASGARCAGFVPAPASHFQSSVTCGCLLCPHPVCRPLAKCSQMQMGQGRRQPQKLLLMVPSSQGRCAGTLCDGNARNGRLLARALAINAILSRPAQARGDALPTAADYNWRRGQFGPGTQDLMLRLAYLAAQAAVKEAWEPSGAGAHDKSSRCNFNRLWTSLAATPEGGGVQGWMDKLLKLAKAAEDGERLHPPNLDGFAVFEEKLSSKEAPAVAGAAFELFCIAAFLARGSLAVGQHHYTVEHALLSGNLPKLDEFLRFAPKCDAHPAWQDEQLRQHLRPLVVEDRGTDIAVVLKRQLADEQGGSSTGSRSGGSARALLLVQCKLRSKPRAASFSAVDSFRPQIQALTARLAATQQPSWRGLYEDVRCVWMTNAYAVPPAWRSTNTTDSPGMYLSLCSADIAELFCSTADLARVHAYLRSPASSSGIGAAQFVLRPRQEKAVQRVVRCLRTPAAERPANAVRLCGAERRCQLVAACGVGKTYIMYRVAMELWARFVVVVVPLKGLACQTYDSHMRAVAGQQARPNIVVFCSETGRSDIGMRRLDAEQCREWLHAVLASLGGAAAASGAVGSSSSSAPWYHELITTYQSSQTLLGLLQEARDKVSRGLSALRLCVQCWPWMKSRFATCTQHMHCMPSVLLPAAGAQRGR